GIGFPHSSAHVRMNVGGVRIKLIIKADFVKLLTAMASLLTALIGLTEALKQRTKQKKRGRRH
ncbi:MULTISPECIES: hypothetical protein, partial [unclassified Collinsella]|uniref:hypothetical protein n=1 Tax=unclassified Collinsella TaxID=2637548 RepID=UPI00195D220D